MMRIVLMLAVTGTLVFGDRIGGNRVVVAEDFPAFTDPTKAGPDFDVQGEYVGIVGGSHSIAAQVIAMGDGKFDGVLYGGGLPGAGWDERTQFHFRGESKDGVTSFVGLHGERLKFDNSNFRGTLQNGDFSGNAEMFLNVVDDSVFHMKKVYRESPTLGARPPQGAIVLFDGQNVDEWVKGVIVERNLLNNGTDSKRHFQSIQLHLEFCIPFMPTAQGTHRGNSGVYLKGWEIQIGDSFGWTAENRQFERLSLQGRCGSLMKMAVPRLNMCLPPLSWQTFDLDFDAAKFDAGGRKTKPAFYTVRQNGVVVFDRYVMPSAPPGGEKEPSREQMASPIHLQAHDCPVRFRNIWVKEK
ncbi:MAG: DUF1080 domain-containing protein [Planctomycetales bacterium]|nr:DUF1080 domain-containing protein [Planctomycetales bacterium]